MNRLSMMVAVTALFGVVSVSVGNATPPPNYPVEAFDEVGQCMADPLCVVPIEERIDGDISLAEELTYRNPVCVSGCIVVCTTHACWCEADEKCD